LKKYGHLVIIVLMCFIRELEWEGDSLKVLRNFPSQVKKEIGDGLQFAQRGETHKKAKIFKGTGSGVYQISDDFNTNTFRSVYYVKIQNKIFVLHCFRKKSTKGISTPKHEVDKIKERLKFIKQKKD